MHGNVTVMVILGLGKLFGGNLKISVILLVLLCMCASICSFVILFSLLKIFPPFVPFLSICVFSSISILFFSIFILSMKNICFALELNLCPIPT